jgi:ribonuclease G
VCGAKLERTAAVSVIDEILAHVSPGESRVALLAKGEIVELRIERHHAPSLVGRIYLARVAKVVPAMDAAFLDLGMDGPAFLNAADASEPLVEGASLVVQIRADAFADKVSSATARPSLVGPALVYRPGQDECAVSPRIMDGRARARLDAFLAGRRGWTARTAAARADDAALVAERTALEAVWLEIETKARTAKAPMRLHDELPMALRVWRDHPDAARLVVDGADAVASWRRTVSALWPGRHDAILGHDGVGSLFEARGVEEAIERAIEPRVALPNGATLIVEETAALVAIDVNLGAGGGRGEGAILEANLEAARAIAREVRLRGLAGRIVVDFVAMARRENRDKVLATLRAAMVDDPAGVRIAGYTATGLVELTRRRDRPSLTEVLCGPRASGNKTDLSFGLDILRAASRAQAGTAPMILRVAPAIASAFDGVLAPARRALEQRLGRTIVVEAQPARRREDWELA